MLLSNWPVLVQTLLLLGVGTITRMWEFGCLVVLNLRCLLSIFISSCPLCFIQDHSSRELASIFILHIILSIIWEVSAPKLVNQIQNWLLQLKRGVKSLFWFVLMEKTHNLKSRFWKKNQKGRRCFSSWISSESSLHLRCSMCLRLMQGKTRSSWQEEETISCLLSGQTFSWCSLLAGCRQICSTKWREILPCFDSSQ